MTKLKCGCRITEEGFYFTKCKDHKIECHHIDCKNKRVGSDDCCNEHNVIEREESDMNIDAFGGSDF